MEQPIVAALAYGTFLVDIAILAGFTAWLLEKHLMWSLDPARDFLAARYREIGLLVAAVATSGSLYLSNVLGWTPCRLCWFQRIAVYPMVVLFATSLWLDREDVRDYVIPLAVIGIPISAYHYVIQRMEQFQSAGCSVLAVSCSTEYTFYLGYITIPMMALTALTAVLLLVWRFGGES